MSGKNGDSLPLGPINSHPSLPPVVVITRDDERACYPERLIVTVPDELTEPSSKTRKLVSDVPWVLLRLAGGRGVMPCAKRSAFVMRLSIAAPSTLGTSARRVARAMRKKSTNFCILTELFFRVVTMNARKRLEDEKER